MTYLDMRREVLLREINQGALAGMQTQITEQAADLVLAAVDRYDAHELKQAADELVLATQRAFRCITYGQHVHGCIVHSGESVRERLRAAVEKINVLAGVTDEEAGVQ